MTIDDTRTLQCTGCQAELEIDAEYYDELAGTEIACPECDTTIAVPAPEKQAQPEKKKLGLHTAAPAAAAEATIGGDDETHCPNCGAEFTDADAILCMACGTNRATGEQVTGVASPGKRPRTKAPTSPRQAITGVIAVLVIAFCAVRAYLLYTGKDVEKQTSTVAYAIAAAHNSDDYAESVLMLEDVLHASPRAENYEEGEAAIEWALGEAEKATARAEAMEAEIARARNELDRDEAIRILDAALQQYPDASNTRDARDLRDQLRNTR